jgi:hypothetical protein
MRTRAEVLQNIRVLLTNARATLSNGAAPIEKRAGAALALLQAAANAHEPTASSGRFDALTTAYAE